MVTWRDCFRRGFAPHLSTVGLLALRLALETDDPRLMQGCTTNPPPLNCVLDVPCEGACPIAFACWQGGDCEGTIGAVEEAFGVACYAADQALGDPAECRFLLNWWDDTPRDEARRLLLVEVELALGHRTVSLPCGCEVQWGQRCPMHNQP